MQRPLKSRNFTTILEFSATNSIGRLTSTEMWGISKTSITGSDALGRITRRTNEIGIRMALGAERAHIIWMVLREVFAFYAVGLAIGLAAAWGTTRFIESFLFG